MLYLVYTEYDEAILVKTSVVNMNRTANPRTGINGAETCLTLLYSVPRINEPSQRGTNDPNVRLEDTVGSGMSRIYK